MACLLATACSKPYLTLELPCTWSPGINTTWATSWSRHVLYFVPGSGSHIGYVCNHPLVLLAQDPGTSTCPHLNPERFAFPGTEWLASFPKGNAPTTMYAPHPMSQLIRHGTVIRFPRSQSTSAVSVLRVYQPRQPPLRNIPLVRASM